MMIIFWLVLAALQLTPLRKCVFTIGSFSGALRLCLTSHSISQFYSTHTLVFRLLFFFFTSFFLCRIQLSLRFQCIWARISLFALFLFTISFHANWQRVVCVPWNFLCALSATMWLKYTASILIVRDFSLISRRQLYVCVWVNEWLSVCMHQNIVWALLVFFAEHIRVHDGTALDIQHLVFVCVVLKVTHIEWDKQIAELNVAIAPLLTVRW